MRLFIPALFIPPAAFPVILVTNTVAVKVTNGGVITTKQGVTVFDPTPPDDACLTSPHDVPLALMQQSPVFQPAPFSVGPTSIGTTQYVDAFQRANFWKFVGGTGYHTLLTPHVAAPVVVNLPGTQGLAARFGSTCGPLAILD